MRSIFFTAALLAATLAHGQIKITPADPLPNRPILIAVDLPSEAGWESLFDWEIDGAEWLSADDQTRVDARQNAIHVWAAPGKYRVRLSVDSINWEQRKRSRRKFEAAFTVSGTNPQPPPPIPDPPVPPTPVSFVPWVAIVTDPDSPNVSPDVAKILSGTAIHAEFIKRGWVGPDDLPTFQRVVRSPKFGSNIAPERRAWLEAAAAKANGVGTFPVLVWCPEGTGEIKAEPLCSDEAAQLARILQLTGAK